MNESASIRNEISRNGLEEMDMTAETDVLKHADADDAIEPRRGPS